MSTEDLHVVYAALSAKHSSVLKLAFEKFDKISIASLKLINNVMSKVQLEGDYAKMRELDSEFHDIFFNLAENPYIA